MKSKRPRKNKETTLELTLENDHTRKKDRDKLSQDPRTPQQQKLPFDEGVEPAPAKATELAAESAENDLEALIL